MAFLIESRARSTRLANQPQIPMTIRTRFAPSPTGYLHIGGVRTALFSWLHARQNQGQFILRIEDTDRERSTEESVQAILDGMKWLELDWDEGPFFQTQRMDRYTDVLQKLLADDHAYPCYCSKERLDKLRQEQMLRKEKPRYDGHCRNGVKKVAGVEPVIRFRNPQDGQVVFDDLVKGRITVSNAELDDLIIARPDGTPTYNFTVVVDDAEMDITHVIRGDDHVNNTPRQINILRALGADLPVYAHVPMILGEDGKRLSKRHGAVGVMQFKEEGYLPAALLNYLVRLGWSHQDEEIFSRARMLDVFDINNTNRAPSTFNRDKLRWLNQHHLKESNPADIKTLLADQLKALGLDPHAGPALEKVIEIQRERAQTFVDMAEGCAYLYTDILPYSDAKVAAKQLKPAAKEPLELLHSYLEGITDWQAAVLHDCLQKVVTELEIGFGKVGQPLRFALTAGSPSPALDLTLELVGKDRSLNRIKQALAYISEQDQEVS